MSNEFLENLLELAINIAKHRGSDTVESKDINNAFSNLNTSFLLLFLFIPYFTDFQRKGVRFLKLICMLYFLYFLYSQMLIDNIEIHNFRTFFRLKYFKIPSIKNLIIELQSNAKLTSRIFEDLKPLKSQSKNLNHMQRLNYINAQNKN